ncbi:MAG: DEAD/DEAH box helicase, partial [Clostridia bacterium]|nr:DEAD/DEAH box helicase [Clostridia bacterium]
QGEIKVLCVSMESLMHRLVPMDLFRRATLRLMVADRIEPTELVEHLVRSGYERVDMVEGKGQCAIRGAIVDVYPPSETNALRMEFFDDEVDSIRSFDCISQRSLHTVKQAVLPPACEVLLPEEEWQAAAQRLRGAAAHLGEMAEKAPSLFEELPPLPEEEDALSFDMTLKAPQALALERKSGLFSQEADLVEKGMPFRRINAFVSVLVPETVTALDWLPGSVLFWDQPDQLKDRAEARALGFQEELLQAMERGDAVKDQASLLFTYEELAARAKKQPLATLSEFLRGLGGMEPKTLIELDAKGIAAYQSQVKELAKDVKAWRQAGYGIAILSGGVARGKRVQQALSELESPATFTETLGNNLVASEAIILPGSMQKGFIWPQAKMVLVSDSDVYGAGYRKVRQRKQSAGEKIAAFTDLKVGDYVVHEDHGVGIYQGTVRLQSEGTYRDYLYIQYLGSDKLYVPTEQLDRVQRFIGNQDVPPKLNKLGGGEWQRQKNKVKAGLKAMAFDLVKLYAQRSAQKGYAFHADTPWQRQFEDQFHYELTPDQQRSVQEITRDMESPTNMDRLLCGDVGYGKTEVALRAAFKAVMDGKQVALLAPTTILAQQHYNTILRRFEGFPVTVEMVSRFKSPKEVKEAITRTSLGEIDILVGTHRLLNKDVKFKDLGLLIVDEEQRFGVQHKETIKNLRKNVDVLTLSATPIPRTLHMSMVGIRDMSVLETPPEERYPVQTYVLEYSDSLVRDAILRE